MSSEPAKQRFLKEAEDEYVKRLSSSLPITFDEKTICGDLKSFNKMILKDDLYIAALDIEGLESSSTNFSKIISKQIHGGTKEIIFLIGGSNGLNAEVKKAANIIISLSRLTFTHHFTRLILLEQLYRAHTILQGTTYHK